MLESWRLNGRVLVSCNCDWGCPCNFNARPTAGKCEGGWTWHVDRGSADRVALDDLNFSVYVNWPAAIHEGNGEGVILIDERADSAQRAAIEVILGGKVGGPWGVLAWTWPKIHGPHAGSFAKHTRVASAERADLANRSRHSGMNRDEKLRTEEEIDVLGREAVLRCLEIDAVENDVQVVAVGFDFGMVPLAERVFDGEFVKVEDVAEDRAFFRGWLIEVDPDRYATPRFDPGRVHPVNGLGGPALVLVDPDQSPLLTVSAACAAASRATGTRYGEQLT